MDELDYSVEPRIIHSGYDRKTCWVQTRGGVIPPATAVVTTQKLRITGSDIFYGINDLRSEWMQTTGPNPYDCTVCERYGSDNALFVSRLKWSRPNTLAP